MVDKRQAAFWLGVALCVGPLTAAQEAKKPSSSGSMEKALEQAKLTGMPILAFKQQKG